jgi:hypothetical protein
MKPFQSYEGFLRAVDLADINDTEIKRHCVECKEAFSFLNVWTPEGWVGTQRDGLCECCREKDSDD